MNAPATDEQTVEQLASEVDAARDRLGELVTRLDRRRQAVGRQVPLVLVFLAIAAIGGSVARAVARRWAWRREVPLPRLTRFKAALRRLVTDLVVAPASAGIASR